MKNKYTINTALKRHHMNMTMKTEMAYVNSDMAYEQIQGIYKVHQSNHSVGGREKKRKNLKQEWLLAI